MDLQRTLNSLLLEPIQVSIVCVTMQTLPITNVHIIHSSYVTMYLYMSWVHVFYVYMHVYVQRVPRYELLLKDLLKHTNEVRIWCIIIASLLHTNLTFNPSSGPSWLLHFEGGAQLCTEGSYIVVILLNGGIIGHYTYLILLNVCSFR